jgi:hypothetical protein
VAIEFKEVIGAVSGSGGGLIIVSDLKLIEIKKIINFISFITVRVIL